jgi:antitoxin component YwqK of YwqJK toxin-antitoxin module
MFLRLAIIAALASFTAANGAERVTESDVKRIFSEAIKSAGYRIDGNTLAAIDVDAKHIAKTFNDAKSTTIYVDESKGYREGFYYCLYGNGKLQGAGYYRKGKRIGPWRIYYQNSQLSLSLQYDDQGREQGQLLDYYENGNISSIKLYANGKLAGSVSFFYENGQLRLQQQYAEGLMNGFSIIYWPNGNIKKTGYFKAGRQDGEVVHYNEDGSLKEKVNYVEGVRQ